MRSLTRQRLCLLGGLSLASLVLPACDSGLDLLEELRRGAKKPPADAGAPGKDPGPGPACQAQKMGGESSCKSVGTWKDYAWNECSAAGLVLGDYKPIQECGDGNYRYVEYTCCKATTQPPPPPSPPGPSCLPAVDMGSETSCKPVGTWKDYASSECIAAGLVLGDYSPFQECGDGNYRYVKYTCCK